MKQFGLADERSTRALAPLTFKVATEEREFEQIHRLNYETFVQEIPQHESNPDRLLVDQFHHENTYFICVRDGQLIGMVAARGRHPFSLDQKLQHLDSYLPPGRSVCEIRLLSIRKEHRHGRVLEGLLTTLARHCLDRGYDIAIISGNVMQERMYRRLGFVPFGPQVGTDEALYQPMYRELTTLKDDFSAHLGPGPVPSAARDLVNLLPGPVSIRPEVRKGVRERARLASRPGVRRRHRASEGPPLPAGRLEAYGDTPGLRHDGQRHDSGPAFVAPRWRTGRQQRRIWGQTCGPRAADAAEVRGPAGRLGAPSGTGPD